MATTLSVMSKTSSTITFSVTKTSSTVGVLSIGTGNDWESLYTNPTYQKDFGGGTTGTLSVLFENVTSNKKFNANAAIIGGGLAEISGIVDSTLPAPAPTVTFLSQTPTSATFAYSTPADGGYYAKNIQYSLDNGSTWNTGATVTSGSASTGEFTISNLTPDTNYTMKVRTQTTAGETEGESVSFYVEGEKPPKKFFGSVNGHAEQLNTLYGSSNNEARILDKLYGSAGIPTVGGMSGEIVPGEYNNVTAFDGDQFWSMVSQEEGIEEYLNEHITDVFYVAVYFGEEDGETHDAVVIYNETNEESIWESLDGDPYSLNELGISAVDNPTYVDYGDYKEAVDYINLSLSIDIDRVAKIIYQRFGHVDYYGEVVYYTDSARTVTDKVYLYSQTDVNQLSRGSGNTPTESWNAVIGDVTIPNNMIKEVTLTDKVTTLKGPTGRNCFLANCTYATKVDLSRTKLSVIAEGGYFCSNNIRLKELYLPDTVTQIGNGFCINAGTISTPAFSPSLVLPPNLTTIGNYFLSRAETFNQDLSLPQTLTSIGTPFMGSIRQMVGTINVGSLSADIIQTGGSTLASITKSAPSYSTGILIAGANRTAWMAKFPDSSSSPYYRKLIDAGY